MPSGGRTRVKRTCKSCWAHKIGCDKVRPACSKCVTKTRVCEYPPEADGATSDHADTGSDGRSSSEQLRVADTAPQRQASVDPTAQCQFQVFDGLLTPLQFDRAQCDLSRTADQACSTITTTTTGIFLKQGDGREHYVNRLHWAVLCEPVDLDGAIRSTFSVSRSTTADELCRSALHRDVCDRYIEAYISTCHPIAAMIHIPTFRARYEDFWTQTRVSSSLFALILATLHAGALSLQEPISYRYRDLALQMIDVTGFPDRPSLDTLRAYLICRFTTLREDDASHTAKYLRPAFDAADILGLYFTASDAPVADSRIGERRHTWVHLAYLDATIAIAVGKQPQTCLKIVELFSKQEDMHMADDQTHMEQDNPSQKSIANILITAKTQVTLQLRRLLERLCRAVSWNDFQEMEALWVILDTDLTLLSRQIVDGKDSDINDLALNRWTRHCLSLFSDRCYYLMCYPFLFNQSFEIPGTYYDQAITSSLSAVIRCAELSCNPDYERFFSTWPGNQQPVHALMILIKHAPAKLDLLARETVDNFFALCGDQGGLISEVALAHTQELSAHGVGLWTTIKRLRASGWSTLDWDAELGQSRKRAVQCVRKEVLAMLDTATLSAGDIHVACAPTEHLFDQSLVTMSLEEPFRYGEDLWDPTLLTGIDENNDIRAIDEAAWHGSHNC